MNKLKTKDKEVVEKVLEMYRGRTTTADIARYFSCYPQVVTALLKREKVFVPKRTPTGNPGYFEDIDTDTKAYLAGFIAADGALVRLVSRKLQLTITIHKKDRIILDVLKSEIESSNTIQHIKGHNHVRLCDTHKRLTEALLDLGITERKSLSMKNIIPNIAKDFRKSFIRGYFDGDGSINVREVFSKKYYSRKQVVVIRGTEDFLLGLIEEAQIEKYHISKTDSIPSLVFGSKEEVKKFFNYCYKDATIFLSRKRDKFLIALYHSIDEKLYKDLYTRHISQDQTISYSYKT